MSLRDGVLVRSNLRSCLDKVYCEGHRYAEYACKDIEFLRHFINCHITLLKDRFQKTVEFLFIDLVRCPFEIANHNITDVITVDNLLCTGPIWSCIQSLDIILARTLQRRIAPLPFMPGPA